MSVAMQKQTSRNLVLSANSQVAYGGQLADAALTYRASVDASTMLDATDARYNDQGAVGHGTDFATTDVRTAWRTMGTMKGLNAVDQWLLGWMMAFAFGEETVTQAANPGPFTHTFAIPTISALMPCTTIYAEDTDDIHRYFQDMAAKTLSIDIPERGPINGTLDLVGTGRYTRATLGSALPAPSTAVPLLGSDVGVTITPAGSNAVLFSGRQRGLSAKVDRGSAVFESSGDGLTAGSVQAGTTKFSFDCTIMADAADDVRGWFEDFTQMNVQVATNPAKALQLGFGFPAARFKAAKLGNYQDKVMWGISLDEGTALQVGNTPAVSAFLINNCAGYLIPA